MFNQPNTGLPFDPIAIGVLPSFLPYVQSALAMLESEIISKASQNPARTAIYNQCCSQFLQNQNVHRLLVTVSEYTMMLIEWRGMDHNQALQKAVYETLAMKAGVWFSQNPQYINNAEAAAMVSQASRDAVAVNDQIAAYINTVRPQVQQWQQPQQQGYNNTHAQQTFTNYPNNAVGFGVPSTPQYGAPSPLMTMHGGSMGMPISAPEQAFGKQEEQTSLFTRRSHSFVPVQVDHFANQETKPTTITHVDHTHNPKVGNGQRRVVVRGAIEELSAAPATSTTMPHARASVPVIAAGTSPTQQWRNDTPVLAIAIESGKIRTLTLDAPHAVVYDPELHFVMHEVVNGIVSETLGKRIGDIVDYTAHEMDVVNIDAIKADQRAKKKERVIGLYDGIAAKRKVNSDLPDAETQDNDITLPAPVRLQNLIAARSLDVALELAQEQVLELDPSATTESYDFTYRYSTPLHITSPELLSALQALSLSANVNELLESMIELAPLLPGQWHQTLDARLAAMLTDILRHRMGISWTISSFVEGYLETKDEVRNSFGELVYDLFTTVATQQLVDAFISGMQFSEKQDTLRWGWLDYVLVIPFTYDDLSLACNERSGAIIPHNTPELYAAMRALLDTVSPQQPCTWNRSIVTSDNCVFKIHQSYFNPDFVVLEFNRKPA